MSDIAMNPRAFFAHPHISEGVGFWAFSGSHDLLAFAESARTALMQSLPTAFCPFVRIDMFQTQLGEIKINELESLDAMIEALALRSIGSSGLGDAEFLSYSAAQIDAKAEVFRYNFMFDKLVQKIGLFINQQENI